MKESSRRVWIRLHPEDDVIIASQDIAAGTEVAELSLVILQDIPAGHKISVRDRNPGAAVRRYNQVIGFASRTIRPGEHVHVHNLEVRSFSRDYAYCADARLTPVIDPPAMFHGIVRTDGRVATRNYVGIISTVNCSATVSRRIAEIVNRDLIPRYENVHGAVPIMHGTGCGMASKGEGIEYLRRTLAGYAKHVNFGAVLVIGLGCEVNQMDALFISQGLNKGMLMETMTIQEYGGTVKAINHGVDLIRNMLPVANIARRQPVPASHLILGLQCGGSDGYSGISANPALGAAVDLLVANGGTAILSETPEIYGAEHLLTRRAISPQVGRKILSHIEWWERYTARNGGEMDNNPSPGNKAGGLTTILEKSLGAISKGGTTNIVEVYGYAEPVTAKGLVFMDTPGHDPVSATGQVAGGANLICFTTGRGSVYGCKPAPSLKLATNTVLYDRMEDDMDINCGAIIDGEASIEELGQIIFSRLLELASGTPSRSETHGFGDEEFVPWMIGAVM
ncbi:MAG: altronate dehydratase [Verrucomicrobia bacterium]|nr:altronate dehydratase [Verrucomicrobiota bacterium]